MNRKTKLLVWCCGILFVLALTAVLYFGFTGMQENIAAYAQRTQEQPLDPVESFRTVRQQMRAMQKAQLNDIAHDAHCDEELKNMAQRQLLDLCEREEQELTLEGVLSMRGWENAVVTVHADCVNVLLQAESVTRQESSLILELVCRETGAMSGNVKIIPIK